MSQTPITDRYESEHAVDPQDSEQMRALELAANGLADALRLSHSVGVNEQDAPDCECSRCLTIRALTAFQKLQPSPHDAPRTA